MVRQAAKAKQGYQHVAGISKSKRQHRRPRVPPPARLAAGGNLSGRKAAGGVRTKQALHLAPCTTLAERFAILELQREASGFAKPLSLSVHDGKVTKKRRSRKVGQ
jgi:hypothetical protein